MCESPSVHTEGERTPALRVMFLVCGFSCPSRTKSQVIIDKIANRPQKRKEPRQPKRDRRYGVTRSPIAEPTWTDPPYSPCPSDECLPRLDATPAPATKAAPEPRPTMKRHVSTQTRMGKSGSNMPPSTRIMEEPISTGR